MASPVPGGAGSRVYTAAVPTQAEHILGIVESFVLNRYRERLRIKPLELLDDLHHKLPSKLDPRFTLRLAGPACVSEAVVGLMRAASAARHAFVMGGFAGTPEGNMPLEEALAAVDMNSAAVASIELGQLAFYKSELTLVGPSVEAEYYLLVKDPKRRNMLARRLEAFGPKG
jgi:hypothetical protein